MEITISFQLGDQPPILMVMAGDDPAELFHLVEAATNLAHQTILDLVKAQLAFEYLPERPGPRGK